MNYRHKLLNQQNKNQVAQLEQEKQELTEALERKREKKVQYKGDLAQLGEEHEKLKEEYWKHKEDLRDFLEKNGIRGGKLEDLDKHIKKQRASMRWWVEQAKELKDKLTKTQNIQQEQIKQISQLQETERRKNQAIEQLQQNQQDNLRKINVLFDDNAVNYETVDFNGLYSLLEKVAERERESKRWWK